ncbi:MAG: hypothetical protein KF760_19785 [Candidatus Eremiobacteraeota bacterium]|nr:hypothetical protein [Candidatus Eremiobacteraeota bacterium]MCW5869151.1 hypothetical protein [Candidatus Eremiobacteraeota bacterium]
MQSERSFGLDKFDRLHQEVQELKQRQARDHQNLPAGLATQRDNTREVAEKVDVVVEEQSKAESLRLGGASSRNS